MSTDIRQIKQNKGDLKASWYGFVGEILGPETPNLDDSYSTTAPYYNYGRLPNIKVV